MKNIVIICILTIPFISYSQDHSFRASFSKSYVGIITQVEGKSLNIEYHYNLNNNITLFGGIGLGVGKNQFTPSVSQEGLKMTLVYFEWEKYADSESIEKYIDEINVGTIVKTPNISHYSERFQDLGLKYFLGIGPIEVRFSGGFTSIFVNSHFHIESSSGEIKIGSLEDPVRIQHHSPTYVSYWDWGNTIAIDLNYNFSQKIKVGPHFTWRGYYKSLHNFYAGIGIQVGI